MMKKIYFLITFVFLLSGCATITRHAVPENLLTSVRVFGMRDIRAFSGMPSESFKNDFLDLLEEEKENCPSLFNKGIICNYSMLAISGGAANGAYGAGLLNGWSKEGTRPVFKIVTGISTGAIIAPFAFLGSSYDERVKEFYTRYSTKDIVQAGLSRNALTSTKPLECLINQYADEQLLKEIAVEHKKGRRLYIGTTNLDAQRLVIWDMGKIASVGDDNAIRLFRKIILASVSIPVAFPPVYFTVEAGDKTYNEMHVDGGMTKQVFFLYDVLQGFDKALKEKSVDLSRVKYNIYIIRNGYSDPIYKEVPDRMSSIAERSVDTMMSAQGAGDLYQIYLFTKVSKGNFNLAYIPTTNVYNSKEPFDVAVMQKLFNLGFEQAEHGYPWRKIPPGMEKDLFNSK
ncbi:MAG: patatin-like phospholipase family protein [Candidatus Omnitrophica bacterium]|nr:patatin-like phospholipase family protein [Candidatus Omnitrophota bacterium]